MECNILNKTFKYKEIKEIEIFDKIYDYEKWSKDKNITNDPNHKEIKTKVINKVFNSYFTDFSIESKCRIIIEKNETKYELNSENNIGFTVILLYSRLNKQGLWSDDITINVCNNAILFDYRFDRTVAYEIPEFAYELIDKVNNQNIHLLSHLITSMAFYRMKTKFDLLKRERNRITFDDDNLDEYIVRQYNKLKNQISILDTLTLEGMKVKHYLTKNIEQSKIKENKIFWISMLDVFSHHDSGFYYTIYKLILNDNIPDVGDLEYFE